MQGTRIAQNFVRYNAAKTIDGNAGSLSRSSECFNTKRRCFNPFVGGYAFVFPPLKEVLAFMHNNGPFCKRATCISA